MSIQEIHEISSISELEKLISDNKTSLIIIKFWAEWCGPCRVLAPIIERIDSEKKFPVKFFSVNIDKVVDVAVQYQISAIPALLMIKNGVAFDRKIGSQQKEDIEKWIVKKGMTSSESAQNDNAFDNTD